MSTQETGEAGPPNSPPNGQPTQIERRAPRWMKIVLILSLAGNLAVAGLLLGAGMRGGPEAGPHRSGDVSSRVLRDRGMPLTKALTQEERRAIGRDIRRALQEAGPRRDREAEFETMLSLLRADTFDTVAFANHLQAQAAHSLVRIQTSQDALIRHLATMSVAERRAYADRVEAVMEVRGQKPPK